MSRVRTKTVKRASKSLIEKYYPRLSEDFESNKRIIDSVAYVPSKRLRNKVAGYTSHLMKRIAKGPVNGVSFALQEEERERRDQYVPEKSALDVIVEEGLVIDSQTGDLLKSLGLKVQADVKNFTASAPERRFKKLPAANHRGVCERHLEKVCLRLVLWSVCRRTPIGGFASLGGGRRWLSDAPNYLKFSPLPPKRSTRPSLYVGPRRWPATDTYYREFLGKRRKALHERSVSGCVVPDSVDPGDAVELVARDGSVQFGLVSFSLPNGTFDCITADGSIVQGSTQEVAFVLRGLFAPLPSLQYDRDEVSQRLQAAIGSAHAACAGYVPLLRVVYAYLALDERPRAVDFEDVCSRVARILSPYDSTAPLHRVDRLAVYLAMAYHTLFFVRAGRSPFVAVATQTMDAVQKVMFALTQTELDHGVSQMKLNSPSWLGTTLRDFLEHWVLWNDPRITRAVVAILEKCENHRRVIDSPHAISSAIERLGGIRLFPWVHPGRSAEASSESVHSVTRDELSTYRSPLFTTNLAKQCTLLDRNTAVSLERDATSPRLNIYVPYVSQSSSILSKISPIGTRARTVRLGGSLVPLLPESLTSASAFQRGVPRQALRLSLTHNWRTLEWDAASAEHDVVEVLPHEPSDGHDFSEISRLLSTIDPTLSDHELQIPNTGATAAAELEAAEVLKPAFERDPDEETSWSEVQGLLATQAQAAAGRIAAQVAHRLGLDMMYLITVHGREELSDSPGWHERLRTDAYVPIGRPLDSSLALLAQQQLTKRASIPRRTSAGKLRASLSAKVHEVIEPQLQLATVLEDRDEKFWALRTLQAQLEESHMFHIYRCVVLQPSLEKGGHLVPAFCLDLGINVELFVPAHTEQIFPGDQVIGTEILELDPLQGLFIVSI